MMYKNLNRLKIKVKQFSENPLYIFIIYVILIALYAFIGLLLSFPTDLGRIFFYTATIFTTAIGFLYIFIFNLIFIINKLASIRKIIRENLNLFDAYHNTSKISIRNINISNKKNLFLTISSLLVTLVLIITFSLISQSTNKKRFNENAESIETVKDSINFNKKKQYLLETSDMDINMFKEGLYVWSLSGLNLRKQPNLTSEKIDRVPFGYKVKFIGSTNFIDTINIAKGLDLASNWGKVKYKKHTGYLFTGYLSKLKPLNNSANQNFPENIFSFFSANGKILKHIEGVKIVASINYISIVEAIIILKKYTINRKLELKRYTNNELSFSQANHYNIKISKISNSHIIKFTITIK